MTPERLFCLARPDHHIDKSPVPPSLTGAERLHQSALRSAHRPRLVPDTAAGGARRRSGGRRRAGQRRNDASHVGVPRGAGRVRSRAARLRGSRPCTRRRGAPPCLSLSHPALCEEGSSHMENVLTVRPKTTPFLLLRAGGKHGPPLERSRPDFPRRRLLRPPPPRLPVASFARNQPLRPVGTPGGSHGRRNHRIALGGEEGVGRVPPGSARTGRRPRPDRVGARPLAWVASPALAKVLLLISRALYYLQRGLSPLHDAVAGGHADCVRLLLLRSAAPSAADADGDAPLHLAAAPWASEEALAALLLGGAPPSPRRKARQQKGAAGFPLSPLSRAFCQTEPMRLPEPRLTLPPLRADRPCRAGRARRPSRSRCGPCARPTAWSPPLCSSPSVRRRSADHHRSNAPCTTSAASLSSSLT